MIRYSDQINPNHEGQVKIPKDWIDIENIEKKAKNSVIASYILKDRSYIKIMFTKTFDYILERR